MSQDPKSCPLCRAEAETVRDNSPNGRTVGCSNIKCYFYSQSIAVKKWNEINSNPNPDFKTVPCCATENQLSAMAGGIGGVLNLSDMYEAAIMAAK